MSGESNMDGFCISLVSSITAPTGEGCGCGMGLIPGGLEGGMVGPRDTSESDEELFELSGPLGDIEDAVGIGIIIPSGRLRPSPRL